MFNKVDFSGLSLKLSGLENLAIKEVSNFKVCLNVSDLSGKTEKCNRETIGFVCLYLFKKM